jgi:hypothetical protein
MEKTNTGTLEIHYNDGSDMQVEYVRQEEVSNIATRIGEAIESNELLIELEDKLLVIPLNNIKYIEISPAPSKLPKFAIRNARLI